MQVTPGTSVFVDVAVGGFDSTYSLHLAPYISEQEFASCIKRLNTVKPNGIYICIVVLLLILFFVMFGVGGAVTAATRKFAVGVPLTIIGFVGFAVMGCVMACVGMRQSRNNEQKLTALLEEFNKEFLPRGIQWRLRHQTMHVGRGYDDANRSGTTTRIEIEIAARTVPAAEVKVMYTAVFPQPPQPAPPQAASDKVDFS